MTICYYVSTIHWPKSATSRPRMQHRRKLPNLPTALKETM